MREAPPTTACCPGPASRASPDRSAVVVSLAGCYGPPRLERSIRGATMGHPNEDLVRRGYDAFSSGDMQTLREMWHPDIVWHVPGRSQISGDHRGVDEGLGYFGQRRGRSGGALRVEVHDVVANDEHAVGLHSTHAERAGKTLDDNTTLVFHVRDGKVTEVWQYQADQYAADELFG